SQVLEASPTGNPAAASFARNQAAILDEGDNLDNSVMVEQGVAGGEDDEEPSDEDRDDGDAGSDVDPEEPEPEPEPEPKPEPEPEPQGKGKGKGKGKRVAFKPRISHAGGRKTSSNTFTVPEQWNLCDVIRQVLPHSECGWKLTAKTYNGLVVKNHQHTVESLKGKYTKLLKMKKPTGEGEASKLHEEALEIEELLHAQEEAHAIDDPWSASEDGQEPGSVNPDVDLTLSGDELSLPPPGLILPHMPALSLTPTTASSLTKPCPKPVSTPGTTPGTAPVVAPAPPPFGRPKLSAKHTATKATMSKATNEDIIDVTSSGDSDVEVLPNPAPAKRKGGSSYHATW
ncbi:hypothetical protein FRC11_013046, partial [Ceratobasidium sp. 423]